MHKKFITFISLILLVVVISGCSKDDNTDDKVEIKKKVYIQEIVQQSEVDSKLTLSATVVPKEYSMIRSLVPGTIEYLAPVGSEVYLGQPLFSIRDAGIENNYFNALQSFQQTQITSNQGVQQAELALNGAKAKLDLARIQYDSNVSQTKQAMFTAEDSASLAYNSAYNSINQILINYNTRNLDDPSYSLKDILSSNQSLKSDTTDLFIRVAGDFKKLANTANKDDLTTSLQEMNQVLAKTKEFVDSTSILLQHAIANQDYMATAIAIDKSTNSTYQTSINGHLNSIISSISNLENTKIGNKVSNNQAQSQLDLAEIEYNNAEIALQNAKDGASLEQSISQSQFDGAAYNYNNLTLASPFSGTILSHAVSAGEQISVGQELIEIGNLDIIEMSVDVDVDFARAIKLGDEVLINSKHKGLVTEIDPIGDLQSGKVGIKVQSQEANQELIPGSTAEVEFSLIYLDVNTIVVPIKSVTIEASGNYVFLAGDDNNVIRKNVNLGQIYGDKVSVLSGLEIGDRLILLNGVFVSIGDEVEIVN